MPTTLPQRRQDGCPVIHLVALPVVLLLASTLVESRTLTTVSALHVLVRSGEFIANADLGPGRLFMER